MIQFYPLTALTVLSHRTVAFLAVLFVLLLLARPGISQEPNANYTRSYLNNVVEIGLSDFGLITGEDSTRLFFIAVRHSSQERVPNTLKSVKFYGNTFKSKGVLVSEVRFDSYTVALYQAMKPKINDWQRYYFYSLHHKKGKLSTFRDKWLSDKIWAVHETKIEVLKVPKKGGSVYTLKVPLEAGVARGMPIVNNEGFIAGIFAESTLGKKQVKAINMKDIADALYQVAENSCYFFNMVEWGTTDDRCVLEELARKEAEEKAKMEAEAKSARTDKNTSQIDNDSSSAATNIPTPRQHFIDYGIHANMLAAPLMANNPGKDNYFGTRSFHAGLSLHFNIDKSGANRLTLKPRYGSFYERNDGNIWASPGEDVRILITSYQYAELPVVLERRLFTSGNYSMSIGAGYSPSWVFGHKYKWVDKAVTNYISEKVSGGNSLIHRFIGELYLYESKSLRLGAVYVKDLSGYPHPDYNLEVNGVDYKPFADRKKSWYIGLELGLRLRGGWNTARR